MAAGKQLHEYQAHVAGHALSFSILAHAFFLRNSGTLSRYHVSVVLVLELRMLAFELIRLEVFLTIKITMSLAHIVEGRSTRFPRHRACCLCAEVLYDYGLALMRATVDGKPWLGL